MLALASNCDQKACTILLNQGWRIIFPGHAIPKCHFTAHYKTQSKQTKVPTWTTSPEMGLVAIGIPLYCPSQNEKLSVQSAHEQERTNLPSHITNCLQITHSYCTQSSIIRSPHKLRTDGLCHGLFMMRNICLLLVK